MNLTSTLHYLLAAKYSMAAHSFENVVTAFPSLQEKYIRFFLGLDFVSIFSLSHSTQIWVTG